MTATRAAYTTRKTFTLRRVVAIVSLVRPGCRAPSAAERRAIIAHARRTYVALAPLTKYRRYAASSHGAAARLMTSSCIAVCTYELYALIYASVSAFSMTPTVTE